MLSVLGLWQSQLWTAVPAIVQSVNWDEMTVSAQPTIQAQVRDAAGALSWQSLPQLIHCPLVFPSAGGFILSFPIAAGDEVLIVFASRCIDAWWQQGGIQVQAEFRMHDLSDGFALPGPRSQPRKIADLSHTNVQLRNDAGTALLEITPAGVVKITTNAQVQITATGNASITSSADVHLTATGDVDVNATGNVNLSATNINSTGKFNHTGDFKASGGVFTHNSKDVGSTHKHSGVSTGGSNTGNPV